MLDYSNPFLQSLGNVRAQPQQNQFMQPQNQYDFSGWGDRLGKIEQGIAGLTDQFNNFQKPGDVAPEYTGNAAPEPLGQTANAPGPLGGIESLVAEPAPHMRTTAINEGRAAGIGFATDPAPPGTVQLGAPQQTSIGDIYNAGLTPGESSWEQLQLGLPRQGENWAAPWLQGGGPSSQQINQYPFLSGYRGSMNDINAIEDYRVSQIDPNVQRRMQGPQMGTGYTDPVVDPNTLFAQKTPTQGWRPGSDMPYPQQAMDANADFWRSKGLQSSGGVSPQQVQQGNPQYSNLLDLSPDHPRQLQPELARKMQAGRSLGGPIQQQIQQGLGTLV